MMFQVAVAGGLIILQQPFPNVFPNYFLRLMKISVPMMSVTMGVSVWMVSTPSLVTAVRPSSVETFAMKKAARIMNMVRLYFFSMLII